MIIEICPNNGRGPLAWVCRLQGQSNQANPFFTMEKNVHSRRRLGAGGDPVSLEAGRVVGTRALDRRTVFSEPIGPKTRYRDWWSRTGSNRRPPACKAGALPTELRPQSDIAYHVRTSRVVGLGRLELPTSRLSGVRSNHLSYRPESGMRCTRQLERKRNGDGNVPQSLGLENPMMFY